MTTSTSTSTSTTGAGRPGPSSETSLGLHTNCFAGLVVLPVEVALGVAVNLTANRPATDTGRFLPAAFGALINGEPVVLSVHAVLGTLLVVTALVRAAPSRRQLLIAATPVAPASTVVAWLSGARFVGAASNTVCLATADAATLAYAPVLCVSPAPANLAKAAQ